MDLLSAPQIYAEQLMPRGYGLPLWKPEPPRSGEIEIGDVGFLQTGRFCRVFNAMRLPSDAINLLGVPEGFEPLVLPERLLDENEDFLPQGPIYNKRSVQLRCSGGLAAEISGSSTAASYTFNCSNTRGAVAVLGSTGKLSQVWRNWVIPVYITENIASWHAFALQQGYDVQQGDLIFISGFVKAAEWGIAAFASQGRCHDVSFSASVGSFASARFGLMASNELAPFIEQRCGPSLPKGDSRDCLPKNQTLFISYYKQKSRRPFFSARGVAVTTKGDPRDVDGTGERRRTTSGQPQVEGPGWFARLSRKCAEIMQRTPADSLSDEEGETSDVSDMLVPEQFEEVPDSVGEDATDFLDDLLDYILEGSAAVTAIACHQDLHDICGLLEHCADWPVDLPAHLRKVAPWINVNEHGVGSIGDIPQTLHSPPARRMIAPDDRSIVTAVALPLPILPSDPAMAIVPQRSYTLQVEQDRAKFIPAIKFSLRGQKGINLADALQRIFYDLDHADDQMLDGSGTVTYCIEWPGYAAYNKQKNASRVTSNKEGITRSRMAVHVAEVMTMFIEGNALQPTSEQTWRVGPGFIELADLWLLELQQVSKASLQPVLAYRPRSSHPTRSQSMFTHESTTREVAPPRKAAHDRMDPFLTEDRA